MTDQPNKLEDNTMSDEEVKAMNKAIHASQLEALKREHQKSYSNTTSDELDRLIIGLKMEYYDLLHKYGYADFKLDKPAEKGYDKSEKELHDIYVTAFQNHFNSLLDTLESEAENIADTVETEDGEYLAVDMGKLEQLINKRRIK